MLVALALRMRRMLCLSLLLAACGGGAGDRADAAIACPESPPVAGQACDPGARCVYDRCASDGIVRATCAAGDGGDATWSIASEACAPCNGRACSDGSLCIERRGGALITDCAPHACGDGPLDCDCACGAGSECELPPPFGSDAVVSCRVDCGSDICP